MWEERVLFHYTLRISKSFSWWIKQCIQRNAVFIFGWLQFIKYLIIVAINACLCSVDISIYCVTKISPDQPPTSNLHVSSPPTQHCDYHHNVSTPSQDSLHVTSNSLSTSSITPNLQCQLRMSTRQQLCWHFGLDWILLEFITNYLCKTV